MRTRSFLFLPIEFWALSLALHLTLWAWVRSSWRNPSLDLTGLTLELVPKVSAQPSRALPDQNADVWRRADRPKVRTRSSPPLRPVPSFPGPSIANEGTGTARSYSVAEVSRLPEALNPVKPLYPPEAKRQGIEGVVILRVDIDATGAVKKVDLVQGLGYGCDEMAIEALWRTQFRPALFGDMPVPVHGLRIPYRFELNGVDNP